MVANGYFMPNKGSSFCTLKLMKEMYEQTCYCPMTLDTRLEPCLHPPSCEQLGDILCALIEANGNYESQAQADKFNRLAKSTCGAARLTSSGCLQCYRPCSRGMLSSPRATARLPNRSCRRNRRWS